MSDGRDPEGDADPGAEPEPVADRPDADASTEALIVGEDAPTELLRTPQDAPTEALTVGQDAPTEVFSAPQDAPTELLRAPQDAPTELLGAAAGLPGGPPIGPPPGTRPRTERTPLSSAQRTMLWVAGGLLAVLALVGLFLLGTRIPDLVGPDPVVTPTPTPTPTTTPTPTATVEPVGPVAPGDYRWDELLGGECVEPYSDAWQEEYTVVDCAEPHGGQLVFRGSLDPALAEGAAQDDPLPPTPYPGEEDLRADMSLLCSAPGVIDFAAAEAYSDLVVQGAYPVTAEQWREGYREYSCFVSRSSDEPIVGSLAVSPPAE